MTPRAGLERLAEDLAAQRAYLRARAPAYDRVLAEVAALAADPSEALHATLDDAWAARRFTSPYDRPLLVLAALRDDALAEGASHPLHAALAAERPDPSMVTTAAVRDAAARASFRAAVGERFVQTNETARAVAWRWPLALLDPPLPVALIDVGASAGLNLVGDALPPIWTDAAGAPLPVSERARVRSRTGFDARPVDPGDPAAARWLLACIWAGETDRLVRLDAALDAWRRADPRPAVHRATAAEIPGRIRALAATVPPGTPLLAYQTVVRDYLLPDERAAYAGGMRALLDELPLLWLELEAAPPSSPPGPPAALLAHTRQGDAVLARCDWHPRVLDVAPDAPALLRTLGPHLLGTHPATPG